MRRVGVFLCLSMVGALLSGCAAPRVAPSLRPAPGALVWPQPPEQPRYQYVRDLVGEADFIDKAAPRDFGRQVFEFVVGLAFRGPDIIELERPGNGMFDERDRMLVTDVAKPGVVVFNFAENDVELWDEAAPGRRFVAPVAIATDGAGGFWVADSELGLLVRLGPEGEPVGTLGEGLLKRPTGVAYNPATGFVYVSDTATHRIVIFDKDLQIVETIGGRGTRVGEFNFPTFLTISDGMLYVADTLNFRIQVLVLNGEGRMAFGRLGVNVGNMTRPKGVAVGKDGRVYVVESYFDHLLVFSPDGQLLLPIGGTGTGPGKFYLPSGVWTDDRGNVYVADMFNGRVVVFRELTTEVFK